MVLAEQAPLLPELVLECQPGLIDTSSGTSPRAPSACCCLWTGAGLEVSLIGCMNVALGTQHQAYPPRRTTVCGADPAIHCDSTPQALKTTDITDGGGRRVVVDASMAAHLRLPRRNATPNLSGQPEQNRRP